MNAFLEPELYQKYKMPEFKVEPYGKLKKHFYSLRSKPRFYPNKWNPKVILDLSL